VFFSKNRFALFGNALYIFSIERVLFQKPPRGF